MHLSQRALIVKVVGLVCSGPREQEHEQEQDQDQDQDLQVTWQRAFAVHFRHCCIVMRSIYTTRMQVVSDMNRDAMPCRVEINTVARERLMSNIRITRYKRLSVEVMCIPGIVHDTLDSVYHHDGVISLRTTCGFQSFLARYGDSCRTTPPEHNAHAGHVPRTSS